MGAGHALDEGGGTGAGKFRTPLGRPALLRRRLRLPAAQSLPGGTRRRRLSPSVREARLSHLSIYMYHS